MLKALTSRIIHSFAVRNKTQNFFDMNPVFPDFAQKDFDIYNSDRKKINVIDSYMKEERRNLRLSTLVKQKIFLRKYDKFRRYSGRSSFKIDKETKLAVGLDSDFDDFVKIFKRDHFTDKNAKTEFRETLLKLIHRFKCKSQTQLIRLFRISVANSKKASLLEKLRGGVMQQAVLKTAQLMKNYEIFQTGSDKKSQDTQDAEQEAFEKALKQIDEKIQEAENALRLDERGLPKILSNYDPKYGYRQTYVSQDNQDYNIDLMQERFKTIIHSSTHTVGNLQDWSIKNRINRLYFLRRLQYLKKGKKQSKDQFFANDLPLNIREREKIMNELAFKYKEDELMQIPDLNQIYREIDTLIDKVYVKFSASKPKNNGEDEIQDRSPEQNDFLWNNISAEEILCGTLYNDANKNVVLTGEYLRDVSPHYQTEYTLSKIPVNLYRHSQLQAFGLFNEYRQKLSDNLLKAEEIDFEPTFEDFSLEEAQKKYKRIEKIQIQKSVSSTGKARRKKAYAEVKVLSGTGVVTINKKPIQDYFGDTYYRVQTLKPLVFTDTSGLYDLQFNVYGSGLKGQSECMGYALARALIKINPDHKRILSKFGFVGFDFRKKQPKKTNLYSARVRPPYVRR